MAKRKGDYQVDRTDLLALARYWAQDFRDAEVRWLLKEGFDLCGDDPIAMDRLRQLRKVLGGEAIDKIMAEIDVRTQRSLGQRLWRILRDDHPLTWHVVKDEREESQAYCVDKAEDSAEREAALAYLQVNPSAVYRDADGDLWSLTERYNCDPKQEQEDKQLTLLLTTQFDGTAYIDGPTVERPAGWKPPYGLGLRGYWAQN